jgi:hypothetical protein
MWYFTSSGMKLSEKKRWKQYFLLQNGTKVNAYNASIKCYGKYQEENKFFNVKNHFIFLII